MLPAHLAGAGDEQEEHVFASSSLPSLSGAQHWSAVAAHHHHPQQQQHVRHHHHQQQQHMQHHSHHLPPYRPSSSSMMHSQQQRPPSASQSTSSASLAPPGTELAFTTPSSSYPQLPPPQTQAGTSQGRGTSAAKSESPSARQNGASGSSGKGKGSGAPGKPRSTMACTTCRRSKMKCEGPDKAPCKRCRDTKSECVFELAPGMASRARAGSMSMSLLGRSTSESLPGSSEQEARILDLEDKLARMSDLLTSLQQQQAQQQTRTESFQGQIVAPPNMSTHERRISVLEAKVARLLAGSANATASIPSSKQASQKQDQLQTSPAFQSPALGRPQSSSSFAPPPHNSPQWHHSAQPSHLADTLASHSPASSHAAEGNVALGLITGAAQHTLPPLPMSNATAATVVAGATSSPAIPGSPWLRSAAPSLPHLPGNAKRGLSDGCDLDDAPGSDPLLACDSSDSASFGTGARKRQKTADDDAEPLDMFTSGAISDEEAVLCFDSYFATMSGANLHASANSSSSGAAPQRQVSLNFHETRSRSPFLFMTLVAIGARAISHEYTYQLCVDGAMRLAQGTLLPGRRLLTLLDLKAYLLLAVYNGLTGVTGHMASLTNLMGLPTALVEFARLSDEEKRSSKGEDLTIRGRMFLLSYCWASIYTVSRRKAPVFHFPTDVVMQQLAILESSPHSLPHVEKVLRAFAEQSTIIHEIYVKIADNMRVEPLSFDQRLTIIEEGLEAHNVWVEKRADSMEALTQWGEDPYLRQTIPLHHGRVCCTSWILLYIEPGSEEAQNPRVREMARLAYDSTQALIRFGTESRIWLTHSSVAKYYQRVNVPSSLQLLYAIAKLLPDLIDGPALHVLLRRLTVHLEQQIITNISTPKEMQGINRMQEVVDEFRRYLVDQLGIPEPSEADSTDPNQTWLSDDLAKSLESLSADTWLWGSILLEPSSTPE